MKKTGQQLRKIDAPHYRYWHAVWMSFYSAKFYIDVMKRWKGYGIVYLFLLIMVLSIPFSIRMILSFERYFTNELINPLQAIPPVKIENGQVKFDEPMPWKIKNAEGKVQVIIDTTGKVKTLDPKKNPNLRVLITNDTYYFKMPEFQLFFSPEQSIWEPEVYTQTFTSADSGVLSGKELIEKSGIRNIIWLPRLTFWPLTFMTVFSFYLVVLLVFAMMGQLISQVIFKFSITYKQACRLMAVSMTPQVVTLMLYITTQWLKGFISGISIILLSVYFSYAVLANRRDSKKLVRT